MEIRPFAAGDLDDVVALWASCGLIHPANDPYRDIERKLDDSAWGFLVAVEGDAVVGSLMAGYDGHRGWINYLACDPNHRRQGIATALMDEARRLLLERGCPKVNLQVRVGNEAAASFYASLGYQEDEVTSFGMRLIQDG